MCRKTEIVRLSRELIRVPGITGEEILILKKLEKGMRFFLGMKITRIPVDQDRYCLLGRYGCPQIVMSTHVDTVSPGFPFRYCDGWLYGRGACDTRGIMASMLTASSEMLKKNNKRFGLLFVVGEEGHSDGAKAVADYPIRSRYLINGEPTECKMASGTKGALRVIIRVRGRPCHSSVPEYGCSANHVLLDILTEIRQYSWPENKEYGKTLVNIGRINGGEQANVLAEKAEALLMFRLVGSGNVIKETLNKIIQKRAEAEFIFGYEPMSCTVLPGFESMVAGFGTDLPFLSSWGKPILFGPGNIIDAHTMNEKIYVTDLLRASREYQRIVEYVAGSC